MSGKKRGTHIEQSQQAPYHIYMSMLRGIDYTIFTAKSNNISILLTLISGLLNFDGDGSDGIDWTHAAMPVFRKIIE
jgi:hypothetical protein